MVEFHPKAPNIIGWHLPCILLWPKLVAVSYEGWILWNNGHWLSHKMRSLFFILVAWAWMLNPPIEPLPPCLFNAGDVWRTCLLVPWYPLAVVWQLQCHPFTTTVSIIWLKWMYRWPNDGWGYKRRSAEIAGSSSCCLGCGLPSPVIWSKAAASGLVRWDWPTNSTCKSLEG